ncbi:hypothetical protein IW261DRAFT_1551970 [Armillaria novae-zelandiae]|uniref:Reverse transcriptase zinc-binding domain-containing protein n=1 Tax=Armillaria novae-zelandiae TaxID=153914 RepID=A0AA39U4J9_9AGAR|nr:hypothetical protein IW261DRAFT_1551970 [Armillaria novae-zelandiae]
MDGNNRDAMRVFTEDDKCPAIYVPPHYEPNEHDDWITVYTDGSAVRDNTGSTAAGAGGYFIRWENNGYFLVTNSLVMRFRARSAPTLLRWVKGHSGDPGNKGANELAGNMSRRDTLDLLSTLSQGAAYTIIKKIKMQTEAYQNKMDRQDTNTNVELAIAAASERCQSDVLAEALSARFFLWMLLHDGYNVRHHWKHIQGCEAKGMCQVCNVEESMDHILTTCQATGQGKVWALARELWRQKTKSELIIMKGIIMSCGVQPPESHRSTAKNATERFRCILISESAHLIWKIRNDCIINDRAQYTSKEIVQRWSSTMNRRMKLDCILLDGKRFKKKATKLPLVLNMWKGTLLNKESLLENWMKGNRVLVGIIK